MVTCHPSLNCLSRIIKDNLNILYISLEAKAVYSPGPMISFRSTRRIRSYSVRAKFSYPLEKFVGSSQCKNADAKFALMSQKQIPFLVLSQAKFSR